MRTITDRERRHRLMARHGLSSDHRPATIEDAVQQLVVLHATEPASVHLSVQARVPGTAPADIDTALYRDRSLVKQLAMRRTLFAFPRDLLPAAWGSASARTAVSEAKRLAKDAEASGIAADGDRWVRTACAAVLERLADGSELSAKSLREQVPAMDGRVRIGEGTKWAANVSLGPRVLTLLGARGQVMRARNDGHWRTSRPLWARTEAWLGDVPEPLSEQEGYAELVRRWLAQFGPGTEADMVWWLGSTKTAVRRALDDVAAVQVLLESGEPAFVLPDDVDEAPEVAPAAALLPVLDPTTMGWRGRDWYLSPDHTPYLFDSNGNGGTTAWWDGRIVGAWVQDPDVRVLLREDVGAEARAALEAEAARLTIWLDGVTISSVYKSAMMKDEQLP